MKAVLVEAHNFISIVERYYSLSQQVYQIIVVELFRIDRNTVLQIVFKAFNDTTGLDGLISILLVFGAYLRITELNAPSTIITQHANIIKKAIIEIRKLYTEQQVANILNMQNRPRTDTIRGLFLYLLVLV
jgi:hypothetical protein